MRPLRALRQLAVALTGYQLGINPFNQPGVEAYKQELFRRLAKPGYSPPDSSGS